MTAATDRGNRAAPWVALAAAGLLAGACAGPQEAPLSSDSVIAPVAGERAGADAERNQADAPKSAATVGGASPEIARAAPAAMPLIVPKLKELIGKSQEEVAALFGKPALVRNDDPARLIQYRSTGCALDIFLYREGGGFTVSHAEVRGATSVKIAELDCVRGVLKAQTAAGNFR